MRSSLTYSETVAEEGSATAIGVTFLLRGGCMPWDRGVRRSLRRRRELRLRQAPDVRREQVDLLGRQASALRRHDVGLAVVDHRRDRRLAPAVQPDLVGQVGRAGRLIALAVGT